MSGRILEPRRVTVAAALLAVAACRPPVAELPVAVRGHSEVLLGDGGRVTPLLLDAEQPVGLCLTLPDARDTSRWEGTLRFGRTPSPAGAAPPAARIGRTVCFDAPPPPAIEPSRTLPLCLEVHDRFDGSSFRLPCATVAFQPEAGARRAAVMERRAALLGRAGKIPTEELVAELDELAAAAVADEIPLTAVNLELVAVHFLTQKGAPEARTEAGRRLAALPAWFDRPEAGLVGATVAFQRAELDLATGDDRLAWQHLDDAERRFLRLGSPMRFTVTMRQASMLARRGAGREARQRLRAALDDCRRQACTPELEVQAQSDLAWYVALDPDATEAELREAERTFEIAAGRLTGDRYARQRAIQRINQGFVVLRRGRDPAPHLAAARDLLAGGDDEPTARLLGWTELAGALHALEAGDPAAIDRCRRLAPRPDPALSAWALSCVGRGERRRGDLAAADRAFALAIERHRLDLTASGPGVAEVAPGRRAEDFARAARVAAERGDAERAWDLLDALDRLTDHEDERRRCRAAADEAALARFTAIEDEAKALYAELAATFAVPAGGRERSLEPVRDDLRRRLRELSREWPGCARAPAATAESGSGLRALALDDEVMLFERDAAGAVRLARRTALPRPRLRELIDRIEQATAERRRDEAGWTELLEPLAGALLPPELDRLGPLTVYALHGPLQRVPVAALPLPPGGRPGARWLGEATAVAVRPAAARARPSERRSGRPLFVVDPRGDLASGAALAELYRSLFPDARVLAGAEATAGALLAALPGASWLHVDGHGVYEPGFPELSALHLADRPVPMIELAGRAFDHRLVNLSACRTGRWPVTADSGRYGIGGLLTRLGAPFVLAGADDLDDRVAADFNRELYRRLAGGDGVPEAYRRALAAVAARHPPPAWAPLMLLHGAPGGAENAPMPTPPAVGTAAPAPPAARPRGKAEP